MAMQEMDGKTHNQISGNLEALKQIFPEAFSEDSVDFEKLKTLLWADINTDSEKYSFNWKWKQDAVKLALAQNTGTLRPDKASSKNWDTTENLYLEWDNLEVLRVMQDSYRGKVKMIYIDPPYNTGKDFVYKDNFHDNVASYKEMMGENMKSNPETNGRYHTDWLNMMYPRLKLARNLLTDDGVIFMSIDDNEVHNFRKIADEVFGWDNFLAQIVWEKVHTRKNSSRFFSTSHEYVIVFARNKQKWDRILLPREDNSAYKNPDNHPKWPWKLDPITAHNEYSADYIITKPNGVKLKRPQWRYWAFSEKNIEQKIANNEISWGEGESYPMIKRFLSETQNGLVPTTLFDRKFAGDTAASKKEIDGLMDLQGLFEYIKPTKLLKRILQISCRSDDIVLDFFSWSWTTAHATMDLNAKDWGNRKFICVQLHEEIKDNTDAHNAGYKNICEIGKERIRRAGEKVLADNADEVAKRETPLDVGFKVFKLDTTNLKKWETTVSWESEEAVQMELAERLQDMTNPVKEDRESLDMIYEVMLKNGMDLSLPLEEISMQGKNVFGIADNYLVACLEKDISLELIKDIAKLEPKVVVFYDDGFADDIVKVNAVQQLEKQNIQVRVI